MHLTLHITSACNMRCSYCYSPPPEHGVHMSVETARRSLEMLSMLNKGSSCGVVFFGGEPLLRKELIRETVSYARELEKGQAGRFHFKITTNGVLLDQEFIDYSIRENILIAMSLDGTREAHDAHRKLADGGPSFEMLYPKLKMLIASRPYSSVLMVVNPDSAKHLSESVSLLLEEAACRYLIVSLNYAAPWTERDFKVLSREYDKLGKLYVKWTLEGRKFYLSPFEVKISSHVNRHNYKKERCELATRQLSVGPDGSLYPCVQFTKAGPESEWCIGSVESGIDEARRERLRELSEADKSVCRDCAVKERCNNNCGCLNWQSTGSIEEVSPVLCRNEQMLMPFADRVAEKLFKKKDPLFLHKHYNSAFPVLSLLEDAYSEKTTRRRPRSKS